MANIVVAIYNPLIRQNGIFPYFETLLSGLKSFGNNVLCFEKIAVEMECDEEIPDQYLEKLKNFKPDLFILVNNQFWDVSKHFDVPIIIYDVDSPNIFCNINQLKGNKRYKYLTIQKSSIKLIKEILMEDTLDVQYLPPFTGVRAEKCEQSVNIGFCGSHWLWNDFRQVEQFLSTNPTKEERMAAKAVINNFIKDPFVSFDDIYKRLNLDVKKKIKEDSLFHISTRFSGLKRLRCLLQLEDLGLEIRGYLWNQSASTPLKVFPELLLSWSNDSINNTQTTQDFYNSAKIGFNINHIQAKSGFSWRVCDILASNACLVSEQTPDLLNLGFPVATFNTSYEARQVCKALLEDSARREEYVAAAHEKIDAHYRFESVHPLIEEIAGISLHSPVAGSLEMVRIDGLNSKTEKNKPQKVIETPSFPVLDKSKMSFANRLRYSIAKSIYKKISI